jgi:hypothetical protein
MTPTVLMLAAGWVMVPQARPVERAGVLGVEGWGICWFEAQEKTCTCLLEPQVRSRRSV